MPNIGFQARGDRNISLHLWTGQKIRKKNVLRKALLKTTIKILDFSTKIFSDFLAFFQKH